MTVLFNFLILPYIFRLSDNNFVGNMAKAGSKQGEFAMYFRKLRLGSIELRHLTTYIESNTLLRYN